MALTRKKRIRYAVVGLGHIAQVAVLPAFANTKNSELAALVSDDPGKLEELGKKYGVEHRYNYAQYQQCLASGEVDAVVVNGATLCATTSGSSFGSGVTGGISLVFDAAKADVPDLTRQGIRYSRLQIEDWEQAN